VDKNVSILIIGGNGTIGTRLIDFLVTNSYQNLRVLDRMSSQRYVPPSIPVIKKNTLNINYEDFIGVDVVIDLSISAKDTKSIMDSTNGSNLCMVKAKMAGVKKYIFASTYYCDAPTIDGEQSNEISTYGIMKLSSESLLNSLRSEEFLTHIIRLGCVVGYSIREPRTVVNKMLESAMSHNEIMANNNDIIPIVDIRDVCDSILQILFGFAEDRRFQNIFHSIVPIHSIGHIINGVLFKLYSKSPSLILIEGDRKVEYVPYGYKNPSTKHDIESSVHEILENKY
jgi:nucleoside-diphosphate-sugar epimerase